MKKLIVMICFLIFSTAFAASWVLISAGPNGNIWKYSSTGQLFVAGPATYPPGVATFTPTFTFTATPPVNINTSNTSIGTNSGPITSLNNSFYGAKAGQFNTGSSNSFFGEFAGTNWTSGVNNVIVGTNSGSSSVCTGSQNTLIGANNGIFMSNIMTGEVFLGTEVGNAVTIGDENTFLGVNSAYFELAGGYNTFIGGNTGANCLTCDSDIFLGDKSGYYETGNNKFVVNNAAASTTSNFMYGDMNSHWLSINGNVTIIGNHSATSYSVGSTPTPGVSFAITVLNNSATPTPVIMTFNSGILTGHTP